MQYASVSARGRRCACLHAAPDSLSLALSLLLAALKSVQTSDFLISSLLRSLNSALTDVQATPGGRLLRQRGIM